MGTTSLFILGGTHPDAQVMPLAGTGILVRPKAAINFLPAAVFCKLAYSCCDVWPTPEPQNKPSSIKAILKNLLESVLSTESRLFRITCDAATPCTEGYVEAIRIKLVKT